jgi:hypothetical protein
LQISGATSSSPLEPNGSAKTAAFSMIHAAAITGDKNGLSKAESPFPTHLIPAIIDF